MLGKLFKYEIKATARIFLPLYAVLLAYSLLHKLISFLTPDKWTVPEVISFIVYIMLFAGICVMTIVVTIQRFYKNLLTEEGYLMFTLPTKPWKHIVSKLVVSMMWTVISAIVASISIGIIAYSDLHVSEFMQYVADFISGFFGYFGVSSALVIIEALLVTAIGLAVNILLIYSSIAVGQLFNNHRVLASLGAFIVISTVSQIIFTIVGVIGSSIPILKHITEPGVFVELDPLFHFLIWSAIIFLALLSAGYFVLTNYILSRRLNLE